MNHYKMVRPRHVELNGDWYAQSFPEDEIKEAELRKGCEIISWEDFKDIANAAGVSL